MGHGSIIFVVGTIIIAGLLVLTLGSAAGDADEQLNSYQHKELSRNMATTGLQVTVRKLADDKNPGTWKNGADYKFGSTAFRSGTFRTQVIPVDPLSGINTTARSESCPACSGDTVDVVARGFNGYTRDPATGTTTPVRQTIFARYVREYADGGIPPSFRNVITTDTYIQLNGNVQILAINNSLNASIHTNGDLTTNGNSFLVEGYGTYTGNEYTSQEDNFVPNIDYNGAASNVFWAPHVEIPAIDMDALRAEALNSGAIINPGGAFFGIDGDVTPVIDFTNPGAWPWTGTYDYNCSYAGGCGTEDNPFIMVVEKVLNFANRVKFRGYGVIVSAENIFIEPMGSDGGVKGELTADDETKIMLATPGNIDIAGNAKMADGPNVVPNCNPPYTGGITLYAQAALPPNEGVTFHGTPCLVGGIVAPETRFLGGGNPRIIYAAPSETITDPGFEFIAPIGPVLISYSEW